MTQKESVQASDSESSSEADPEFQAGGNSDDEVGEDSDSEGEDLGGGGGGSGGEGEGSGSNGEGSGGEGRPGDDGSQQGDSSSERAEVSCHKAEESGSESGSSSSESEMEVKKAHPSKNTIEPDPNTTLPELDSKDSKEECKTNCCGFVHCSDAEFSAWQANRSARVSIKQWDERDKMTCDHTKLGKEAKCTDPLGMPLDYMESCRVSKLDKMSDYDLCHFYQVGLSGDFPKFPTPHEPTTDNHLHCVLENAWECSQQKLACGALMGCCHSGLPAQRTPHQSQPLMP